MARRLPTYFISHGGGPWPYMPELRRALHRLEASLDRLPRELPAVPRAVLMVSGHWEAEGFDVMAHPNPPMVYDYFGFPPHTYEVVYAAPGAPVLAARVQALIRNAGLPSSLDAARGYDHGAYTPMAVMYPQADMPMLQLALHRSLDPELHLQLGRALAPLRDEGVLIVGSGLSYHNLRQFGPGARAPSQAFDDWLQDALLNHRGAERDERLRHWAAAPSARLAHPREDHLIPLMVAVGAAADEPAVCTYHDEALFGGVVASSFRFGAGAA